MNNRQRRAAFARFVLVSVLVASSSLPVQAFQFKELPLGMTGSFDTTISLGGLMRTQKSDPGLIGIANGGTSRSVNEDGGDMNYGRGSLVSAAAKATHDLDLKYKDFGVFVRGTSFYDAAAREKTPLGVTARDRAGHDAQILDAYARARFDIAGRALNLRVGKQVLGWGESTFIQNGLNVINPIDVTKLRVPGSELKEALIPTPIVSISQELTKNLSVEAYYQAMFYKTRIDQRGTFFSNNDFLSEDGDRVYTGFGLTPDENGAPRFFAPRLDDRLAKKSGQFGVALRHLFPEMNNTELGLYHISYHSRTPIASGIRGTRSNVTSNITTLGTARYFAEYPEDIRLWGASFNTQGPFGIALQGEYTYRHNLPVQVAAPELLLASLNLGALPLINQITGTTKPPDGTEISGYRRLQMSQAQMTATKAFGPTLGAEQWILLGEVGMNYFHNLPNGLNFNGPGVFLPAYGSQMNAAVSGGANQPSGYLTDTSWGYRLVTRMDFPNLIGSATVSPRLAFNHDVRGVGPNFNQMAKAVAVGMNYNLRQTWIVDVGYTTFFGGRTYDGVNPTGTPQAYSSSSNPLKDRDFIASSVSYSF